MEAIRFMRDGGDPFVPKFHKEFGNSAILYLATGNKEDAERARDEMLACILATPMFWMWPPVLRRLRIVTMVDFSRMRYGRVMEWFNLINGVLVAPFAFGVGSRPPPS